MVIPLKFYVKCVEDFCTYDQNNRIFWQVKEGEEFKVILHEETNEYITRDSKNRIVYIGCIDNELVAISGFFKLLPTSENKFNYFYSKEF